MSLTIFRASAGSGKTFQLVQKYLQIVLAGPERFSRILAVTFTNKAAAEMKERVVLALDEIASGKESLHLTLLTKHFSGKFSEAELRQRASQTLRLVLHDYGNFRISTIDSFFQKTIRSFARELNISPGYSIEMDENRALVQAVEKLFLRLKTDKGLRQWLLDFAASKLDSDQKWDITSDVQDLGKALFRDLPDLVRQAIDSAGKNDRETLREFQKALKAEHDNFNKRLTEKGKQALALMQKHGLSPEDFKYKNTSAPQVFVKFANGKLPDTSPRLRKAVKGEEEWMTKGSPLAAAAQACLQDGLQESGETALHILEVETVRFRTLEICLKNLYALGVLSELNRLISEFRAENDLLLISDAGTMISTILQHSTVPFLYEKTGSWLQHILIDEFQDTSRVQFENFLPLLENCLASANQVFVVGDEKQSIYRWRGGDLRLLNRDLQEALQPVASQLALTVGDTNFRSRWNIVAFNNTIVYGMHRLLMQENPGLLNDPVFASSYENCRQHCHNKDLPKGVVQVQFIKKDDDMSPAFTEDDNEDGGSNQVLDLVYRAIKDAESAGFQKSDITILVRTAKQGKLLATGLGSRRTDKIQVVSQESLSVEGSLAVNVLLAALRCFKDPDNELTAALLLHHLTRFQKMEGACSHQVYDRKNRQALLDSLVYAPLAERGLPNKALNLYDLCMEVIETFNLNKNQEPALYRFLDIVLTGLRVSNPTLADFLDWWDSGSGNTSLTLAGGPDAVRIETIHKSKGLEYPVVIIPFAQERFVPGLAWKNLMWVSNSEPPFNRLPAIPVNFKAKSEEILFHKEMEQEKTEMILEALNLFYVAVTRARERLYIFGSLPKNADERLSKGEKGSESPAEAMFRLMQRDFGFFEEKTDYPQVNLRQGFEPEFSRWEIGREQDQISEREKKAVAQPVAVQIPAGRPLWNWKTALPLSTAPQFQDSEALPGTLTGANRGLVIHEILSRLHGREDLDLEIQSLVFQGVISNEQKDELLPQIREMFASKAFAAWFSPDWEALAEREILLPGGRRLRPDRVLLNRETNQARILDYKTGQPQPWHRQQLKDYVVVLEEMGCQVEQAAIYYTDSANFDFIEVSKI